MRTAPLVLIAAFVTLTATAQEPKPSQLRASTVARDGVALSLAWRFAPGDTIGAERPSFDDRKWGTMDPLLPPGAIAWSAWPGVAWLRRHVIVEPSLQYRPIALRFNAQGLADVYLDGALILSTRHSSAAPEIPSEHRDATVIRFNGRDHVFAVRYFYPKTAARPNGGLGFEVDLTPPGAVQQQPPWILALQGAVPRIGSWVVAVQGALIALPVFLALLHIVLFAFDRRARENLFFACEMAAFAVILVHDFGGAFLPAEGQRAVVDLLALGAGPVAITFGLLTYYAVRTDPWPRAWRFFVLLGIVALVGSYIFSRGSQEIWTVYFGVMLIEVIRMETRGRTMRPETPVAFLASFAVFCLMIVLQILINFGVVDSIGGVREVYLFGLLASALGMSIYLARRIGQSRVIELENERKTRELSQARELQLSMLPQTLPAIAGLDIAATTHPAAEVGGDYYDVRTNDGAILLALGDATGHGLTSGIVVTAAKALFNSLPADRSPQELLATCDRTFRAMQLRGVRMCLSLARVSTSEVTIASAAMPQLLVHRKATGHVEEIGTGALPLGSRLAGRFAETRAALDRGDTLLFASDGFAELLDTNGRQLGYDGAAAAFRDAASAESARAVIDRLQRGADLFRGAQQPQSDDMTFVVIRV